MDAQQLILAVEAAGKAREPKRLPDNLCASAKINRATWQRIKAGKAPAYSSLIALQALAREFDIDPHGPAPKPPATSEAA